MKRALTVLTILAAGCGSISVSNPAVGAAGDSCTKTSDCGKGLHCVGAVCAADAPGADVTEPPPAPEVDTTEPPPPDGPDRCGFGPCPADWLGDGACNDNCNCEAAEFDKGDCGHACINAGDGAALAVEGFNPKPLECWNGCAGNPELTTCTTNCIQGLGVTPECAYCFAPAVDCVMTNCQEACADPASDGCNACGDDHCGPQFRACSGLHESAALAVP